MDLFNKPCSKCSKLVNFMELNYEKVCGECSRVKYIKDCEKSIEAEKIKVNRFVALFNKDEGAMRRAIALLCIRAGLFIKDDNLDEICCIY